MLVEQDMVNSLVKIIISDHMTLGLTNQTLPYCNAIRLIQNLVKKYSIFLGPLTEVNVPIAPH